VDIAFAVVPTILGLGAAGLIGSSAIRTAKDVMSSISLLQTLEKIKKFKPPKGGGGGGSGGGGCGGGGNPPVPPPERRKRQQTQSEGEEGSGGGGGGSGGNPPTPPDRKSDKKEQNNKEEKPRPIKPSYVFSDSLLVKIFSPLGKIFKRGNK